MSPFLTFVVAGVLGGMASGLVIGVSIVLFGRGIAEGLLDRQVAHLETRFKEKVLDVTLGRVASFLDQSERLGQIVKRVVEIVQLLLHHGSARDGTVPDAVALQAVRDLSALASKPAPVPATAA